MRTNDKGQLIKYWVHDDGITVINESHPDWSNPGEQYAIYETFEEAATVAIQMLCHRIKQLEKKKS